MKEKEKMRAQKQEAEAQRERERERDQERESVDVLSCPGKGTYLERCFHHLQHVDPDRVSVRDADLRPATEPSPGDPLMDELACQTAHLLVKVRARS